MGVSESDPSPSLSTLLCQEDQTCFDVGEDENPYVDFAPCSVSEDEDDHILALFERETTAFGSKTRASFGDCSTTAQPWLKGARLDAIEWIFNTRAIFGFHFHTAYLSLVYFDRFLSKRSIEQGKFWAVRLLSVACLSLAAKMEERKAPPLSDFPVQEYNFENSVIQRMELLVLNTLDWKMNSITPFSYLPSFATKLLGSRMLKESFFRTVELTVAAARDMDLIHHRPSAIAAAAVLAASDSHLTRETMELKMMSLISSPGLLDSEQIFCCYNLMQETDMENVRTPKSDIAFYASSLHSSSTNAPERSTLGSSSGAKRRLTFEEEPAEKRPLKKMR